MSVSFAEMLRRYQAGDPEAKNQVVGDFFPRVVGLARKYLGRKNQLEDVTQSVIVSFIANHGKELAVIKESEELWELLAGITLRHCGKHNKRQYRESRRVRGLSLGQAGAGSASSFPGFDPPGREPAPDEVAAFLDLMEQCQTRLSPRQQEILVKSLAGAKRVEIAKSLQIAIPTVDREIKKIKEVLAKQFGAGCPQEAQDV